MKGPEHAIIPKEGWPILHCENMVPTVTWRGVWDSSASGENQASSPWLWFGIGVCCHLLEASCYVTSRQRPHLWSWRHFNLCFVRVSISFVWTVKKSAKYTQLKDNRVQGRQKVCGFHCCFVELRQNVSILRQNLGLWDLIWYRQQGFPFGWAHGQSSYLAYRADVWW